jgi:hypothetical protein
LDKDSPFSRPVERIGCITSHTLLGGFITTIAESSFRYTQP